MATAILVDGAFFPRRFKQCLPSHDRRDPASVAHGLGLSAYWHLVQRIGPTNVQDQLAQDQPLAESRQCYPLFFFDFPPLAKRMHTPLGHKSVDFGLNDSSRWRLSERATVRLIENPATLQPDDGDFEIDAKQKGVDMRLGLDVASLAFKKQVDQIVMVAADADFVPAAKLARREGSDVILDRLGDHRAASDLVDHVDAIRDCFLPEPNPLSAR